MKFTDFQSKLNEMIKEPLSEAEEWVLGFDFELEYTSAEGRDIQKHLEKKFRKNYSGSGSGGSGFDVSFDGSERELKKIKKYVEKEFGPVLNSKYTNFYQYEGFEAREIESIETATFDLTETSAVDEATKWKMGDGRPRGGSRIENVRFWDLPKNELEYIIKDAGEAMRANPKARKATTGPGNWADQVNDASTVLGWRKKNGIKESVEQIDEKMDAAATKRFYDGVHAELKKVMDNKYYREFRAANDGRALDNVINHFGKSRGMRVDKTVKSIIDKYGRNRDEYVKLSFQSAAKGRMRESVELDELRKDVFVIVDRKGKVLASNLDRKQSHKEVERHKNAIIVLDPDAKVGDTLSYFAEQWTADSVTRNAEIGSKKGYGINIKKTGAVTKTPHKHMLMTVQKHGNVRVTFDHGKDEFEGTAKSVALYINKKLGIKESVELEEKNEPTNPTLWKKAIAKAKAKFDVYPSAYANAWASKWYKGEGGGWKKVEESLEEAMTADKLLGIFNRLKNKDTIEIKYDDAVRKGRDYHKFVVTSGKRTVGKARVERIIMKSVDNPRGVAYTLYNRKGNVSLAVGDMGASIVDIKESVELDEAKSPVKTLGKEAKSVLAMAINMANKDAGVEAHPNNLEYFTSDAISAAIEFLDKNSKKLSPAGRHAAREIVKKLGESVSIDEFELEEKVVKGEAAPFVVKQRDGNYVTHTQGKKIKYVGRELDKAQRFTKKDAEYFASRDRGSKVIELDESVDNPEYDEELGKKNIGEATAWDKITHVKDKNDAQKIHGMIVDTMTANLLHKVHDALNDTNKKKFVAAIDKNAAGMKKMVDFAYKQVK